jgi:hypothetical protein
VSTYGNSEKSSNEKSSSEKSSNEKSSSEEEIKRGPLAPSTFNSQALAEADKAAECAHGSTRRRQNGTKQIGYNTKIIERR